MKCNVVKIWQENEKKVFSFIKKRVRDKELAQELTQSVLLKVFNYCEKKSDVRNVSSWIYQIAYNTIVDYYKVGSKFTPLSEDADISVQGEKEDLTDWIDYFVNIMPKKYSEPLVLADLEGIDQRSIAAHFGLSLPATKSRIQRARKLLKKAFEECGVIETNELGNIEFTPVKPCCISLR